MPLVAQAHHAVMKGVCFGNYFVEVQALLDRMGYTLG